MTPEPLKEIMREIDFTTADVAIVMGVTRRTVQLWLAGTSPIPMSAAIVLAGIHEGVIPIEWLEDKILISLRIA